MHRLVFSLILAICLFLPSKLGGEEGKASSEEGKASKIEPTDFFSSTRYATLKIEILYEPNCKPDLEAIAFLCNKIRLYCRKNIVVNYHQIDCAPITTTTPSPEQMLRASLGFGIWLPGSLSTFVNLYGQEKTEKDKLVLYILYFPGFSLTQPTAIGETFSSNAFVIFKPRVNKLCEKSILLHEMGHILGLKNTESKDHDSGHEFHCKNSKCAMYWCVGEDQRPESFDAACEEELFAAGARRYY